MAIKAGNVVSYLTLDRSKFSNSLKSAKNDLMNFANSSKTVSSRMKNLGGAMSTVGATLTKSVTLPLVGMGAAITKVGADFEASMSEVQAISGATGTDLEKLEEKAKQMGATTKFSASESAEALKYMSMAGWDTQQMLDGLDGVMNLAAASGEDLGTVSDIVTDALTGFGMKASESSKFADLLAKTSSSANTNVSMLGESFKYVAPIAGSLGYSAEDVAMALGLLANSGIKSSQAGTVLRGAITRLTKPSKEAAGLIEQLGLKMADSEGNMLPFSNIMDQLRTKFAGLTEEQQAQYASTIFGQEAMSGMLAIINATEEDYNKLANATNNYSGSAKEMADTMQNNLKGSLTKLKSALEGAAISLSETLIPMVTKTATKVNEWVDKFNSLDDSTKEMIVKVGLFAAAIPPVLLVVGKLTTGIGSIINVGSKLAPLIGKVLPAMFTPWGLAITGAITAGYLIIKHWDEIKAVALNLYNNLVTTFTNIKDSIIGKWTELKDSAYNYATNMINMFTKGIKDKIDSVKDAASSVANKIKSYLGFSSPTEEGACSDSDKWMPNMIEMFAKGIKKNSYKVEKETDNLAGRIANSLSKVNDYVSNTVGIVEKKFKLWILKNNEVANSSSYLSNQLEMQRQKHQILNQEIIATEEALSKVISKYGEGSEYALEYQNKLLDLKIAQAELGKSIEDTTKKLGSQNSSWNSGKTSSSSGSSSSSGKVTYHADGTVTYHGSDSSSSSNSGGISVEDAGGWDAWEKQVAKDMGYYDKGGKIDYTGMAMVHGSKSKPEYVFNYDQFKDLGRFIAQYTPRQIENIYTNPPRQYNQSKDNPVEVKVNFDRLIEVHGNVDKEVMPDLQKLVNDITNNPRLLNKLGNKINGLLVNTLNRRGVKTTV